MTDKSKSGPGMISLRDYFAAHALQGIIVSMPKGSTVTQQEIAAAAFAYADTMLAARGEPTSEIASQSFFAG